MSFEPTNRMAGLLDNPLPGPLLVQRLNKRLPAATAPAAAAPARPPVKRGRSELAPGTAARRAITPRADYRRDDRLFLSIRQELVEQFQPATFTAQAAVDCLAHDYVRLARANRMLESLTEPPRLSDHEEGIWAELIKVKSEFEADGGRR